MKSSLLLLTLRVHTAFQEKCHQVMDFKEISADHHDKAAIFIKWKESGTTSTLSSLGHLVNWARALPWSGRPRTQQKPPVQEPTTQQ